MSLFSLRPHWPIWLPWVSSTLLLTLYSHGFLLTSLGFLGPITSYLSLGFMGLPSIPYSLCLHCFAPAMAHSYLFYITHCPWVCYSLFLSFRVLLSPLAFSRPIYLFHGPVIHYSYRLGLMVFCSLSFANFSVLLSWATFLTFGSHKKGPSTFSPLNIWSAPMAHMWIKYLPVPSPFLLSFPSRAFLNYRPFLIYIFLFPAVNNNNSSNFPKMAVALRHNRRFIYSILFWMVDLSPPFRPSLMT